MQKKRVVITGIGLMTSCGKGWAPYWDAALQAKSHIDYISSISLNGFPSKLAGEIVGFDPTEYVKKRKSLKVMSREIQLAVASSQLALADGGLATDLSEEERERFGISLGAGMINNELDEVGAGIKTAIDEEGLFQIKKFGHEGIRALFPLWVLKYLPNMPACHVSVLNGLKGPNNTVTTSSAAGLQAIGEAARVIERGDADLMLTGSTDSKINAMGISRFHLLGLLSIRNHIPEEAYCPFDEKHDGLILGEGSGLLVLEEYEHAKKRGANIYAEVKGFGSASDYHYDPRSTEDIRGKQVAMQRAIDDAKINLEDLQAICANGSGVPQQDIQESKAIEKVFGNRVAETKVTSVKPVTGHLIYGSGGVDTAASALALSRSILPPIINLETPAPGCNLSFVRHEPQETKTKAILINSFGFGGQNASLILGKV